MIPNIWIDPSWMGYEGHDFLVEKFRRDSEVGGVRKAALRWKKNAAMPLSVALAVMRDALRGKRIVPVSDGIETVWVAQ